MESSGKLNLINVLAYILQFIYVFLTMTMAIAQDNCHSKFSGKEAIKLLSTSELSSEFKRLRKEPPPCNSKWGSDFHLIMQELGSRLGRKGTHKVEIIKWIGSPDSQSDSIPALKLNADEEILVYHWRGWHDWLYFITKDDRVKNYDWWFAYD